MSRERRIGLVLLLMLAVIFLAEVPLGPGDIVWLEPEVGLPGLWDVPPAR